MESEHIVSRYDAHFARINSDIQAMGVLVIEQMFIGFLLAMLMGLFFWPAKIAGAYIAQEVGLSLASISDPNSQDSSTLVSRIFEAFCILLFAYLQGLPDLCWPLM